MNISFYFLSFWVLKFFLGA